MRCPHCGSVSATSHSERQAKAFFRRRYCTAPECRKPFSTWETTESPAAMERRLRNEIRAELIPPKPAPRTPEERAEARRQYKRKWRKDNPEKYREWQRRWNAANPERAARNIQRGNMREAARREAAETGEYVVVIYQRWGVALPSDFAGDTA